MNLHEIETRLAQLEQLDSQESLWETNPTVAADIQNLAVSMVEATLKLTTIPDCDDPVLNLVPEARFPPL